MYIYERNVVDRYITMPLFNSLGSNYNLKFALTALAQLIRSDKSAPAELKKKLKKRFGGKVYLFHKGRDAIQFSLESLGIGKGADVLTQAFACYAVEEAIKRTGANPVYADVEKNTLNYSVSTLQQAYQQAENPQAVIVQNILGYPADIVAIKAWCQKHNLLLIEDLAQSFGAKSSEGKELGSYGDAVVLSFGRDKIVDAVSGGAAIIKPNNPYDIRAETEPRSVLPLGTVSRDMFYPFLTWGIRSMWSIGLGRLLWKFSYSLNLLISPTQTLVAKKVMLPVEYAKLALIQLDNLERQLKHRRKISHIYHQHLRSSLADKTLISRGTCLRYPFVVDDPDKLANQLARKGFFLSDRWYQAPVDCGRIECLSVYKQGTCPNAENLSNHIFNLPTHRDVKDTDVNDLSALLEDML